MAGLKSTKRAEGVENAGRALAALHKKQKRD